MIIVISQRSLLSCWLYEKNHKVKELLIITNGRKVNFYKNGFHGDSNDEIINSSCISSTRVNTNNYRFVSF